jgi:hypothetical protein
MSSLDATYGCQLIGILMSTTCMNLTDLHGCLLTCGKGLWRDVLAGKSSSALRCPRRSEMLFQVYLYYTEYSAQDHIFMKYYVAALM